MLAFSLCSHREALQMNGCTDSRSLFSLATSALSSRLSRFKSLSNMLKVLNNYIELYIVSEKSPTFADTPICER